MTVGISVTGADASVRAAPGRGRLAPRPRCSPRSCAGASTCPRSTCPPRTGDVTVHLSCTLHMSQAPVTAERRVLYTGFRLPDDGRTSPETAAKLSRIREGSYKTVNQPRQAVVVRYPRMTSAVLADLVDGRARRRRAS